MKSRTSYKMFKSLLFRSTIANTCKHATFQCGIVPVFVIVIAERYMLIALWLPKSIYIDKYTIIICQFVCHRSSECPESLDKFLLSGQRKYRYHCIWSGFSWISLVCIVLSIIFCKTTFILYNATKFLAMIVN